MLVMSRKRNESLVLGEGITVTVVEVRGDMVRLGIVCPREVSVHRQEVYEALYGPPPPARSPEELAFLQAVLNEPDDEAIRLIFADWLEERGDPRGEFIRIQCQLANLPAGPDWQRLRKRERALLDSHATSWKAYLPYVLRTATFERGFVEAAELFVSEFLAHAKAIFAQAPLRRLRAQLPGGPLARAALTALAASPYLARLESLDLSNQDLGDEETLLLAQSPHLGSLRTLILRANHIQNAGGKELAASRHLANLDQLDLSGNPLGDAGVTELRTRFGDRVRC
jgi:carbon storage regulator CsrA